MQDYNLDNGGEGIDENKILIKGHDKYKRVGVNQSKLTISYGKPFIVLMAIVIICLPKMGAPIARGVPLYASVVLGEIFALLGLLAAIRWRKDTLSQIFLLLISLVACVWTGHLLISLGEQVSASQLAKIVFKLLPFTGLAIAFYIIHRPNVLNLAVDCTRYSFYFLLFYALLQLVFGAETVAINYITANYDSSFEEIIKKTNVIHRLGGESFKLFSTYQNGNLFAITLILIAPIAIYSEKRTWVNFIVIPFFHLVIVFCASTTSYISLLLMDFIFIISSSNLSKFALVFVGTCLVGWLSFFSTVCSSGQCGAVQLLKAKLFERDMTVNERWNKTAVWMENVEENPLILFFGEMSTATVSIFEVLPLSIMQFYGLLTMLLFYAFIIYALKPLRFRTYKIGVIVYLISSIGSGGFWLTPTPYIIGIVCGIIVGLDHSEYSAKRASLKINKTLLRS
jgi:hypothetical protein